MLTVRYMRYMSLFICWVLHSCVFFLHIIINTLFDKVNIYVIINLFRFACHYLGYILAWFHFYLGYFFMFLGCRIWIVSNSHLTIVVPVECSNIRHNYMLIFGLNFFFHQRKIALYEFSQTYI